MSYNKVIVSHPWTENTLKQMHITIIIIITIKILLYNTIL